MIDNFRWNFHTISKYVPISVSASYKCKRTLVIVVVVETLVLLTLAKNKLPEERQILITPFSRGKRHL